MRRSFKKVFKIQCSQNLVGTVLVWEQHRTILSGTANTLSKFLVCSLPATNNSCHGHPRDQFD